MTADLRAVLEEFAKDASACQVLPSEMSREEQRNMMVRHLLGLSKALASALSRLDEQAKRVRELEARLAAMEALYGPMHELSVTPEEARSMTAEEDTDG